MPSQFNSSERRSKASKGSVQIKNSNGRLQLVFSYGGRRHYLSTGLADTPVNRRVADFKANLIEEDIFHERFDPTLEKYKTEKNSGAALSTLTPITPIQKPKPSLDELWDRYEQFKEPSVSANTLSRDYERYRSHINQLPTKSLDESMQIRDHLAANVSTDTARRCLTNFSACCDWAVASKLIDANPFSGMASDFRVKKSDKDEYDIDPFTAAERDEVIQAFETDRYYSRYTPLIRFLFFTGCRPSEAIALQWKHIE